MTPRQRDIVLIPVPFSDLSSTKHRPALVLSKTSLNRQSSDVVVAAITSNVVSFGIGVIIDAPDLEAGLLPRRSLIKADKIYTLSNTIIVKRYGRLKEPVFEAVLNSIDTVFGR